MQIAVPSRRRGNILAAGGNYFSLFEGVWDLKSNNTHHTLYTEFNVAV
jgi:hypothetical protein